MSPPKQSKDKTKNTVKNIYARSSTSSPPRSHTSPPRTPWPPTAQVTGQHQFAPRRYQIVTRKYKVVLGHHYRVLTGHYQVATGHNQVVIGHFQVLTSHSLSSLVATPGVTGHKQAATCYRKSDWSLPGCYWSLPSSHGPVTAK